MIGRMLPALAGLCAIAAVAGAGAAVAQTVPKYAVDPFWPKPLPDNQILGQVSGIAIGERDTIWLIHRPGSLADDEKGALKDPPESRCCKPAAPVVQFGRSGRLLRAWGGPAKGYNWPKSEHGIHVDAAGNVWIAGNAKEDSQILKFSPEGKFLMQIGAAGGARGSNDTGVLGQPAHMITDDEAGELYVADGYGNRRIIVFDMMTGAYKRHWGAYGEKPTDGPLAKYDPRAPLSRSFGNPVHCVRLADDGLVYVCDRINNRIQVFKKDGDFVREFRVSPETLANGSVWDLVLSTDKRQKFIHMADGANAEIVTLLRETGAVVSRFGTPGRMAGQFKWVHNLAIDSRGTIYTAEVGTGRRAQRFIRQ